MFEILSALLRELPLGAAIVERDGSVAYANSRFLQSGTEVRQIELPDHEFTVLLAEPPIPDAARGQIDAARSLLQAVGRMVGDAVVVLDPEARETLYANPRFEALTGVHPRALPRWLAASARAPVSPGGMQDAVFELDATAWRPSPGEAAGAREAPGAGGEATDGRFRLELRTLAGPGGPMARVGIVSAMGGTRTGAEGPTGEAGELSADAMGSLTVDGARCIRSVDQGIERLTGYRSDELLGLTIDDLTPPDDQSRDQELFRRLASGEMSRYHISKRCTHRTGSQIPVWVLSSALQPSSACEGIWLRVVYANTP
jgi:PAS domain S-box-containing protein